MAGAGAVVSGALSGHCVDNPRGVFNVEASVTFAEAGFATADTKPIVNLLMKEFPFTEKITGYLDIGQTDPVKDLDLVDNVVLRKIYLDPAYINSPALESLGGVNPPKFFMMRCLAGSGLLYLNVRGNSIQQPDVIYVPPFPLHANKGIFMYGFPRADTHYAHAAGPMPGEYRTVPLALVAIHLRTFEEGNRFQYYLFR